MCDDHAVCYLELDQFKTVNGTCGHICGLEDAEIVANGMLNAAKDQGRVRIHVYQEEDTLVTQRHGEMQWVARAK